MNMVKRFYSGLLAMYFSAPMTILAFAEFAVAFLDNRNPDRNLKPLMLGIAAVLAAVMFFYYKNKLAIARSLHHVQNIQEYDRGGALDRSFILEDRMIAGCGFHCEEQKTEGIQKLEASEKGRKMILELTGKQGTFKVMTIDRDEAERFAAFIKRKNPACVLNIEPKGNGTLQELGAGVH